CFGHFEVENGLRMPPHTPDFGKCKAKALDELDVAERLGDDARHAGCFAVDTSLCRFYLPAQHTRDRANDHKSNQENWYQRPMLGNGIPNKKAETNKRRKQDVDGRIDEALGIGTNL